MSELQAALGLIVFFAIAYALSEQRARARPVIAAIAIAVQLVLAAVLLRSQFLGIVFDVLNGAMSALQSATEAGTSMVFGFLGGAPLPFDEHAPGASFVLAFRALPLLVVVSALTALLTYWRVLPALVALFARALRHSMGLGGAAGFGVTANVILGMVEAPLAVAGYLASMSRSDLFVLMSAGMATIAGTVWVLYASILEPVIPNIAGHLLVASLISVPAAVGIARLMVPPAADEGSAGADVPVPSQAYHGAMDAITSGTQAGVKLFINVVAMLLVLVALVHLLNLLLGLLPELGGAPVSLQRTLGVLMWPLAWLMGIPAEEAALAGQLLGLKSVLNELLAYLQLAATPEADISARSRLILAYALCGFANPGSLGILIAGLATMAPQRRDEVVAMGMRSLVAGTLATFSTGAVVALVAP